MAENNITGITIDAFTQRSGFMGRRITTEQVLTMEFPGGRCILRRSTLEEAGDSWKLFRKRLETLAEKKGIPYQDNT